MKRFQRNQLYELKEGKQFTDRIVRSSDGEMFHVHGVVLASLSNKMNLLLKNSNDDLTLPLSNEVVASIIQMAYTGTCDIREDTIEDMLKAAKKYQMKPLLVVCGNFLCSEVRVDNAVQFFRLSKKYSCEHHFISSLQRFIALNIKSIMDITDAYFEVFCHQSV